MKKAMGLTVVVAAALGLVGCGGSEPVESQGQQEQAPAVSQEAGEGVVKALACYSSSQGDPTSCKSYDTWKSYVVAECQAKGYPVVTYFAVSDVCGTNSYRYVKYTCCQ